MKYFTHKHGLYSYSISKQKNNEVMMFKNLATKGRRIKDRLQLDNSLVSIDEDKDDEIESSREKYHISKSPALKED